MFMMTYHRHFKIGMYWPLNEYISILKKFAANLIDLKKFTKSLFLFLQFNPLVYWPRYIHNLDYFGDFFALACLSELFQKLMSP